MSIWRFVGCIPLYGIQRPCYMGCSVGSLAQQGMR
jgi:hypothetical protein